MKQVMMLKLIALCFLFSATTYQAQSFAADKLVIISPHRKSIQQEFVPAFKKYYQTTYNTSIDVEWLDQGGTTDDVRFIRSKFSSNPKGIGIDVFWGGGSTVYAELKKEKLFEPMKVKANLLKQVPKTAGGVPLYDSEGYWYGTGLSSFGIFFNRKILKFDALQAPKTWADLADKSYFDNIVVADPRRSGTSTTMNFIMLQGLGWEKGMQLLTGIAGNARRFTHSSSDPIKAVVAGDAAAAIAIDFYANAKIGDLGPENLGFSLPDKYTVLDPDPAAILKGAKNRKPAERFIEWLLSFEAQKLLVLKRGTPGGPVGSTLGRMSVNKSIYEKLDLKGLQNPFMLSQSLQLNVEKTTQLKNIFNDLLGAIHIDLHSELRSAWKVALKKSKDPAALVSFVPVSEKELLELSKNWSDNILRNKTINSWTEEARAHYEAIASGKKS